MVDLIKHNAHWLTPFPLWNHAQSLSQDTINGSFNQPSILRFASDTFMEELMALLQHHPEHLTGWIARPETWRAPMPIPSILPFLKINDTASRSEIQLGQKLLKAGRTPREVVPGPDASLSKPTSNQEDLPFKLYQPAHKRFYLVATSLVCRRLGLPDRSIDNGKQEKTGFVIRRLIHKDPLNDHSVFDKAQYQDYTEHAYVMTSGIGAWRNVSDDPLYRVDDLIPEEERLPLFAVNFDVDDDRRRRLLAGLIPVGSREAYMNASGFHAVSAPDTDSVGPGQEGTAPDLRMVVFETRIGSPWRTLLEQAVAQRERLDDNKITNPFQGEADKPAGRIIADKAQVVQSSREQIQTISWYVLLDFAKFLKQYLPNVWALVVDPNITSAFSNPTAEQSVFNGLLASRIRTDSGSTRTLRAELRTALANPVADIKRSMREALKEIHDLGLENVEKTLETIAQPYSMPPPAQGEWPIFYFPLADPQSPASILLPGATATSNLDDALLAIDEFTAYIEEALPPAEAIADPDTMMSASQILDQREGWFVIRCVYERPNCGPYNPPVISHPTEPFQLASFFDPDAPARPIRIPMPMDISPAGLRKFKKNTGFMLSDMLCGQIKRIKKITLGDLVLSILPWPFHKDLPSPAGGGACAEDGRPNFGMLCSLSIPIVTLCALILLIIIVYLFDTFFRWVPFLFTCFKLPGFKAKKQ